jgi:hypothetical protein
LEHRLGVVQAVGPLERQGAKVEGDDDLLDGLGLLERASIAACTRALPLRLSSPIIWSYAISPRSAVSLIVAIAAMVAASRARISASRSGSAAATRSDRLAPATSDPSTRSYWPR